MRFLLRQIFFFVVFIIPWIGRLIVFLLHVIVIVAASIWVGFPHAIDAIADDWRERATKEGMPDNFVNPFYNAVRMVTFFFLVVGWIFFAHLTVFVISLVF